MSVSDSDIAFALETFDPLGGITTRHMMGGVSLYRHGQIFAILDSDGTIFLKAKGAFAARMQAAGARQFSSVDKQGKSRSMGYWTLPEAALDDTALACDWAKQALNAI